jgi:hypothetical protein
VAAAGKVAHVSLRRIRADGSVVPYQAQQKVEVDRPEGPGGPAVHRIRGIPEGRWRLRLSARGSESLQRDIDLPGAACTRVELDPGPAPPPVDLSYEGPPSENGRGISFNLNPLDDANPCVLHGLIPEPGHRAVLEGVRPGAYFLLLWRQGLARRVALGADPIALSVPAGFASGGAASLRVRLVRRGERLLGPLVALAPKRDRAPADGDWFRFTERKGSGWYEFEGLPAGRYEVLIFDGVLGVKLGLRPDPVVRPVILGAKSAVDLEIDLGDLTRG